MREKKLSVFLNVHNYDIMPLCNHIAYLYVSRIVLYCYYDLRLHCSKRST